MSNITSNRKAECSLSVSSRGFNTLGNYYNSHPPSGANYYYKNSDNGYYYNNKNGSEYYNAPDGNGFYKAPNSSSYEYRGPPARSSGNSGYSVQGSGVHSGHSKDWSQSGGIGESELGGPFYEPEDDDEPQTDGHLPESSGGGVGEFELGGPFYEPEDDDEPQTDGHLPESGGGGVGEFELGGPFYEPGDGDEAGYAQLDYDGDSEAEVEYEADHECDSDDDYD